jgi:hypothetical protein
MAGSLVGASLDAEMDVGRGKKKKAKKDRRMSY